MVDLPENIVDLPDKMVDLPDTMVDLPDTNQSINQCISIQQSKPIFKELKAVHRATVVQHITNTFNYVSMVLE